MSAPDEVGVADLVARWAVEALGPVEWASLTVRRRRSRLESLASAGEGAVAAEADRLQHEFGDGPCLESARDDEPFLIKNTAQETRWPRWCAAVDEIGVGAVLSLQLSATTLHPDQDPLGALNLYAGERDPFDDRAVESALVLSVHAANAMAAARQLTTLEEAVDARHHVGMAQGVLMARRGVDPDRAFDLLREHANHHNRKLRDVAAYVVEKGDLPPT